MDGEIRHPDVCSIGCTKIILPQACYPQVSSWQQGELSLLISGDERI